VAGGKMKAVSPLWLSPNGGATNSSGFSGLPGGYRTSSGAYAGIGIDGWWRISQVSTNFSRSSYLSYINGGFNKYYNSKSNGFSVRCVRD